MKQSRQPSPAAVRCRNIQSLANEPDLVLRLTNKGTYVRADLGAA